MSDDKTTPAVPTGDTALEFIQQNAKANEDKTKYTLTKGQALDFYKSQGVDKPTIEAVDRASTELANGMHRFVGKVLQEKINEVNDEDGWEEATKTKVTLSVPSPFGKEECSILAHKTYPKPGEPNTKIEKYAVTTYVMKRDRKLDENLVSDTTESVRKLLESIKPES